MGWPREGNKNSLVWVNLTEEIGEVRRENPMFAEKVILMLIGVTAIFGAAMAGNPGELGFNTMLVIAGVASISCGAVVILDKQPKDPFLRGFEVVACMGILAASAVCAYVLFGM